MSFIALKYNEQECGRKVAQTKRRYIWVFQVGAERHRMELLCSFISGKRRVTLDGRSIHQSKNFKMGFQFEYPLMGHTLRITQKSGLFPLFVNNLDFVELLWEEHRRKKQELRGGDQKPGYSANHQAFGEFQKYQKYEPSVEKIKASDFEFFNAVGESSVEIEIPLDNQHSSSDEPIDPNPEVKVIKGNAALESEDLLEIGDIEIQQPCAWLRLGAKAYIPTAGEIVRQKRETWSKIFGRH